MKLPKRTYTNQARLIKETRERFGLSQAELACVLNVIPQYISNIERNKCGIPHTVLKKLSFIVDRHNTNSLQRAILLDESEHLNKLIWGK